MPEIVKKNPVNDPTQKTVKTHSKFTPNYSRYDTHRFGLNIPHFAMAGVADDDISLRCAADVDTFSLKAPLMQPVKRNMDYFQLPLRALLPKGAELIITNPMFGDDIVAEDVNAVLKGNQIQSLMNSMTTNLGKNWDGSPMSSSTKSIQNTIASIFDAYQFGKLLLSNSSLVKYLGYDFAARWYCGVNYYDANGELVFQELDFDTLFEQLFTTLDAWLNKTGSYFGIRRYYLTVSDASGSSAGSASVSYDIEYRLFGSARIRPGQVNAINIFDLMAMFEEANEYIVVSSQSIYDDVFMSRVGGSFTDTDPTHIMGQMLLYFQNDISGNTLTMPWTGGTPYYFSKWPYSEPINFLRPLAYQCASAEFYTSDKVDNVYSTNLYHQNCLGLAYLVSSSIDRFYEVNGVPVQYDAYAGKVMAGVISYGAYPNYVAGAPTANLVITWSYWHNLLALTRSLKYEDYFVGARKQPLAVGDVTVGVDTGTNTVDVIDVTKKIQVQRFLNQVNRIGRKFSDYVKGILGDRPMKDAHEPIFLGHVADTFGAEETDNTGDGQLSLPNSTTSKLRNNSSRYGFDVHIGEPSVLIGITNYDIVRVYKTYTDRENFHVDRYDAFNPYMQFVGDQEIKLDEIKRTNQILKFGYTLRYMEYKQKVDQCAGGFAAGALPGYARILQMDEIPNNINSDFIRSHVDELDQFYISLTGHVPSYRFNFIVRNDISVTANRPMAYAPSIL